MARKLVMVLAVVMLVGYGFLLDPLSQSLGEAQAASELVSKGSDRSALGTAFTYQGRLEQSGELVEGLCAFEFSLWSAATEGTQVGNLIHLEEIQVTSGLFTVELDFGAAPFLGQGRWLEVSVDCSEEGRAFELLGRQSLTPTPYALYSQNAATAGSMSWNGLFDVPAGFADGADDDLLNQLNCTTLGQVPKWDGSMWACSQDLDTNTTYSAGTGIQINATTIAVKGEYRLPQLCSGGAVPVWNSSFSRWDCGVDANTTYSAGHGLGLAGTEFSVITSTIQTRVLGTCAEGAAVRQVNADGTVVCEEDTDTTYAAGTGLSLVGSAFSVLSDTVQLRISGDCAEGSSIRSVDANGGVTCEPDTDAGGDITAVAAGVGLIGGAVSGDAALSVGVGTGITVTTSTVSLAPGYILPQACTENQVAKWDTELSAWVCSEDELIAAGAGDITTVSPGTGLEGGGTEGDVALAIALAYRLPQTCSNGQPPTFNAGGWTCLTFVAGPGIIVTPLTNTQTIAVNFVTAGGSNGSSTLAARSNHHHDSSYVNEGQTDSVTAGMLANGAVINDLISQDGSGSLLDADLLDGLSSEKFWKLGGNSATLADKLGTTSPSALQLIANNKIAFRLIPNLESPSLVGGYEGNQMEAGMAGVVIAGGGEELNPNGVFASYGVISGGAGNTISATMDIDNPGTFSAIGGGFGNYSIASYATIAGGIYNLALGEGAFIGGGGYTGVSYVGNVAAGMNSAIVGGAENVITGTASFASIGGGQENTANGEYAVIPGGLQNTAGGNYSFAGGRLANAAHTGTFVWGDSTNSSLSSTANNQFIVRASGGVWLGTTSSPSIPAGSFLATSTGAYLSTGGDWTNASDKNVKENFAPVDPQVLLDQVAGLEITQWNYKAAPGVTHIGPVAQDFSAAFAVGANDTSISTVDADGVALAAIQGLYAQVQEKDAKLAAQDARIDALEARLTNLEARQASLETGSGAHSDGLTVLTQLILGIGLVFLAGAILFIAANKQRLGSVPCLLLGTVPSQRQGGDLPR